MNSVFNSFGLIILIYVFGGCGKTQAPPVVSGMEPLTGGYGTSIIISGENFSTGTRVTINDIEVEVVSANETSLTVIVPALTEGEWPVNVETDNGETAAGMFNYLYTVYVAGCENNGSGTNVAEYWKNGAGVALTDGTKHTILSSIALAGNDIWTAGNEYGTVHSGKYWKNTIAASLSPVSESGANDILAARSDLYVAGYESNGTYDVAKYWKNGIPVSLSDGTSDACAFSLFKNGDDIYVAGLVVKGTRPVATYWKNGNPVYLTDGTGSARAQDIFVNGIDVYVCGYERNSNNINVAKYWKNGTPVDLSDGQSGAWAYSIACNGTDVYIVGNDGIGACCWKNGVAVQVDCNPALTTMTSVFITGIDVFIAGSERTGTTDHAYYWRNGTKVSLTDNSRLSVANAVCVR